MKDLAENAHAIRSLTEKQKKQLLQYYDELLFNPQQLIKKMVTFARVKDAAYNCGEIPSDELESLFSELQSPLQIITT